MPTPGSPHELHVFIPRFLPGYPQTIDGAAAVYVNIEALIEAVFGDGPFL